MADVVTSQTIVDTSGTKTVMKFTNISDGSGETLVTKMDASALTFMTEDANRTLAKIYWAINTTNGKSGVEISWAGSGTSKADATIGFFSGTGFHDYFIAGNSIPNNATLTANTSPAGDILFSTKGFVAGDNYTIILEVR
jgi:flagellar capping protein FliD